MKSNKLQEKPKKLSTKNKITIVIILLIIIISIASLMFVGGHKIKQYVQSKQEAKPLLEYEIKDRIDEGKYYILVKVNNADGLDTVKYNNQQTNEEITVNCKGKTTMAIDYQAEDLHDYNFTIKKSSEEETTETLHFEIPRIKGNYTLVNGVYTNEPDLSRIQPKLYKILRCNRRWNTNKWKLDKWRKATNMVRLPK